MFPLFTSLRNLFRKKQIFTNTQEFWEKRYAAGGNSGDGSYGRLALFKATVVNDLLQEFNIHSAIEFGCGDGHQLGLIKYPAYTGLDISPSIVNACKKKYEKDPSKSFFVNNEENIQLLRQRGKVDLALSLDVLYHLVEQPLFESYLNTVFDQAQKLVIIYSTDMDKIEADHVVHRQFTKWVAANRPEWKLVRKIDNPYPGIGEQESLADFFIYQR